MSRSLLNRRQMLIGAATSLIATHPLLAMSTGISADSSFASAMRLPDGSFALALLDERGRLIFSHPLPSRGHGFAFHERTGKAVVFARRPGTYAMYFDPAKNQVHGVFQCPTDRHFYGHGTFSPDGQLLFATENHFDAAAGMIGVYRVGQNVTRIGELPSYGVGPHDVFYDAWRGLLCIANGGIETHPDFGRAKLNLDRMQCNIAFVHPETGDLVEQFLVPKGFHQLSLRHMATDARRRIWLAGQFEGAVATDVPLLATITPEQGLRFPEFLHEATGLMRGYIGSVHAIAEGNRLAISSPKGHAVMVIDTEGDKIVGTFTKSDVCGLASHEGDLISSSFAGKFGKVMHPVSWDNHIGSMIV